MKMRPVVALKSSPAARSRVACPAPFCYLPRIGQRQSLLREFAQEQLDILLGTQIAGSTIGVGLEIPEYGLLDFRQRSNGLRATALWVGRHRDGNAYEDNCHAQ